MASVLGFTFGDERFSRCLTFGKVPPFVVDPGDPGADRIGQDGVDLAHSATNSRIDGVGQRGTFGSKAPQSAPLVGEIFVVPLQRLEFLACAQQGEIGGLGSITPGHDGSCPSDDFVTWRVRPVMARSMTDWPTCRIIALGNGMLIASSTRASRWTAPSVPDRW